MPKTLEQELEALYRELPAIKCRKLCHDACGPIGMTKLELARMEKQSGQTIPNTREMPLLFASGQEIGRAMMIECVNCPMLKHGPKPGQWICSIYDFRPLICRVWGLVKDMRCHYGCTPERWLSPRESLDLFRRAKKISEKWERQHQ